MTKPDTKAPATALQDWLCECKAENDHLRTACYRCEMPRVHGEIKPEPAPWRNMKLAPMTGPVVWVIGQLADGSVVRMHYAYGGGEEQPRFRGWFEEVGDASHRYFCEVTPLRWRPEA